jgi:hypothetical protein
MSHPYTHAVSSAKLFGGKPEDYLAIHHWFDETKAWCPDMRHRAMRHHAEGIFEMEKIFGVVIKNSDNKEIPTRLIGEQHVKEDLGFIPTAMDWLNFMNMQEWMTFRNRKMNQRLREKPSPELPKTVADILSEQNMKETEERIRAQV